MITKIEIALENCEVIVIDGYDIVSLWMDDVKNRITKFGKHKACNDFYIKIAAEANRVNEPFGFYDRREEMIFNRLLWRDIVSVCLYYDDTDEFDEISVYYNEESDSIGARNTNQFGIVNKLGDLCLVISENKKLEDYIDLNYEIA